MGHNYYLVPRRLSSKLGDEDINWEKLRIHIGKLGWCWALFSFDIFRAKESGSDNVCEEDVWEILADERFIIIDEFFTEFSTKEFLESVHERIGKLDDPDNNIVIGSLEFSKTIGFE